MVNKSLKKNNLVNIRNYSKKKNLVGGGGKKKLLIGFRHYDDNTKKFLEEKLKYKESNKVDSNQISLLFSTIPDNLILNKKNIFDTRNCVNNLTTAIKLVEDTMSNYLLYRENNKSKEEEEYETLPISSVFSDLNTSSSPKPLVGGSNKSRLLSPPPSPPPTRVSVSEEQIKQKLNEHIKGTFSQPLHATKLITELNSKKNTLALHLIIYPLPLKNDNDKEKKYNIEYLNKLLEDNKDDMFVVLFPSLIIKNTTKKNYLKKKVHEYHNSLKISEDIKYLEGLKYEKPSSMFSKSKKDYLTKEKTVLKASYDYDYGVYTRNISENFDLEIISTDKPTIESSQNQGYSPSNPSYINQNTQHLYTNPKPNYLNNSNQVYPPSNTSLTNIISLYNNPDQNDQNNLSREIISTDQSTIKPFIGITEQEFDNLTQITSEISIPTDLLKILQQKRTDVVIDESNKKQFNIYANINALPEVTQVILKNDTNDTNTYINANYVASYDEQYFQYIATQCPKKETFTHFWRMVWDNDTPCIVMLTNLIEKEKGTEKEKQKCYKYWPDDTTSEKYGSIIVKTNTNIKKDGYEIRELEVTKNSTTKTVKHYWFNSWPDQGVPTEKKKLLDMIIDCNDYFQEPDKPWIIHCSAGVGRTGTFIAIDHGIRLHQNKKSISVIDIIKNIRKYRNFLVQNFDQANFVNQTLEEYIKTLVKK